MIVSASEVEVVDCMNDDVDNHDKMMMDVMSLVGMDDEKKMMIMRKVLVKIQDGGGDGDYDGVDYDDDSGYYTDANNLVAEDNLRVLIVEKDVVVLMGEVVLQLVLRQKVVVLVVQKLELRV